MCGVGGGGLFGRGGGLWGPLWGYGDRCECVWESDRLYMKVIGGVCKVWQMPK